MVRFAKGVFLLVALLSISGGVWAQSVYDLRQLTQEQWLSMSTHERMNALSLANKQAANQTFLGQFGQYYDDYKKLGIRVLRNGRPLRELLLPEFRELQHHRRAPPPLVL